MDHNKIVAAGIVFSLLLVVGVYYGDSTKVPSNALRRVRLSLTGGGGANCTSFKTENNTFSNFEEQISRGLSPFKGGITAEDIDTAYSAHYANFRVMIIDNKLYVASRDEKELQRIDFGKPHAIFFSLIKLLCRHKIPDVEFVLNHVDLPLLHKTSKAAPIMSWSVSPAYWDLAFPYWSFSWLPAEKTTLIFNSSAWRLREGKAIWRGSTTGGRFNMTNWFTKARAILVDKCNRRPDLCDAQFTSFVQIDGPTRATMLKKYGNHTRQSLKEQTERFKYIVVVDGNGPPSSRIVAVMASGSLVIWQETEKKEFFYPALQPYVHYLPLSRNLDDLYTIIEWARSHPLECEIIAKQAVLFANMYFKTQFTNFYLRRLLTKYSQLQMFTPQLIPGFRRVQLQSPVQNVVTINAGSCEHWTNTPP